VQGAESGHLGFAGAVLAAWLGGTRFVAADLATKQLYVFTDAGRLLRILGGQGEGPGEFRGINFVGTMPGGAIGVSDPVLNRFTIIDSSGIVRRTIKLPEAGADAPLAVSGVLADGRLLTTTFFPVNWRPHPGPQRDTMPMVVLAPDGSVSATLGEFPGPDGIVDIGPDGSVRTSRIPFGRLTRETIIDTFVAVGTGDRPEIVVYAPGGRATRIIRWTGADVPVTRQDVAAYTRERLASAPADSGVRARILEDIKSAPIPRYSPPYDMFVSRSNGELWVREYSGPGFGSRPTRWDVFDSTGIWDCQATVPTGVVPVWIGPDRMLGTWQDNNDLYHVGLFRMRSVK